MTTLSNDKSHNPPGHDKTVTLIVNGRKREVKKGKMSYIEVVHLVYAGEQPSETVAFTVTFSNPHGKDGSLVAGQEVSVQDGMIFNVHKTDRS